MTCGVYKITNLVNGKCYVGQSLNIEGRWKQHQRARGNFLLARAIRKYGVNSFQCDVLKKCSPNSLTKWEQHFMDTLHPEYNICVTAGGSLTGYHHTEEAKEKLSAALMGNQHLLGHKPSEENVARMWGNKYAVNHVVSEENREKKSQEMKGNKRATGHIISPSTREKMIAGIRKFYQRIKEQS